MILFHKEQTMLERRISSDDEWVKIETSSSTRRSDQFAFFGVGMGVFNDDAAIDVVGKHLV